MDKRKRLVKVFKEIVEIIDKKKLKADPYSFLLNKFNLFVSQKRPAADTLAGISKADFSAINCELSDRFSRDFLDSLSISKILSLPEEHVFELTDLKLPQRASLLLLSDTVVLPYELEKKIELTIGFCGARGGELPFANVSFYFLPKSATPKMELQTTIFDLIDDDIPAQVIQSSVYDFAVDDAYLRPFPEKAYFDAVAGLLKPDGSLWLSVKKIFISSLVTKREKALLYSIFAPLEVNRHESFLTIRLEKKSAFDAASNVVIRDCTNSKTLSVEQNMLKSNHLFTFEDKITAEELGLVSKIESLATGNCGQYFKFFLGMFRKGTSRPRIESMRLGKEFQPLVSSKAIEPFQMPRANQYILVNNDDFFQIPASSNFEHEKLLMKYLSVKPVFAFDSSNLYFFNDVAAIFPRSADVGLFYSEGYLNSRLIEFYYRVKFPHHNKFLKRNFSQIPFVVCNKLTQDIIVNLVKEIRELYLDMIFFSGQEADFKKEIIEKREQLDGYIFQLFDLSQDEIKIINNFLNSEGEEKNEQ